MNTHRRHSRPGASSIAPDDTIPTRTPRVSIAGPMRSESTDVRDEIDRPTFQDAVLAHLDAGYNLAFWMLRDEHLAGDALQDAAMKAWRRFESFQSRDGKSWLLAIVRTSVVDLVRRTRGDKSIPLDAPDESSHPQSSDTSSPLSTILRREHAGVVNEAVWSLPEAMREILVLREIEGLSYAQIAQVLEVPVGTVMSRVSRARDAAAAALRERLTKERADGV